MNRIKLFSFLANHSSLQFTIDLFRWKICGHQSSSSNSTYMPSFNFRHFLVSEQSCGVPQRAAGDGCASTCCDLDLWPQNLISTSSGPDTMWSDFGEISSSSYKDIVFTQFLMCYIWQDLTVKNKWSYKSHVWSNVTGRHRGPKQLQASYRAPSLQWATSLFGLVFRSVRNSDWAKVKPKSEVDFFVRTQFEGLSEKTELIRLGWSSDSVQMNLYATDRLIPYRLTFAERKTTSLFRLVQTNRIAKKSPQRNNY